MRTEWKGEAEEADEWRGEKEEEEDWRSGRMAQPSSEKWEKKRGNGRKSSGK